MSAPAWIGAKAGVLGVALAVFRWWQTDHAVVVDASPFPFSLPTAFREALFEGAAVLAAPSTGLLPPTTLPAPVNHLIDRFAWIDTIRLGGTAEEIDTLWVLRIENRGNELVTQAQLRLDGGVVSILRARGAETHPNGEIIVLPDLSPDESITLRTWGKGDASSVEPQLLLQRGKARIKVRRPGDASWGTSGRPLISMSIVITLAILGIIAMLVLIFDSGESVPL